MQSSYTIDLFSPHLFWDVDKTLLDFNRSKVQIIGRVVEYGLMGDWELLQEIYSKDEIKNTVCSLRNMDKVTLSFLAHYFKIEKIRIDTARRRIDRSTSGFYGRMDFKKFS